MYTEHSLAVRYGQFTTAGIKPENQDCIGIRIPDGETLTTKGVSLVIADGVSSAEKAKQASEICVQGFLADYYSTPDTWQVKTSVHRVLSSLNRWLFSSGQEFMDERKGFICALGVMVLKSNTAHIFHVGDTRVYHLRGKEIQQITKDHSVWGSKDHSYLSRAMGLDLDLDIDYWHGTIDVGDYFLLTTDGVHDHVSDQILTEFTEESPQDLDRVCQRIADKALANGSPDNLSIQIVEVQKLTTPSKKEVCEMLAKRPFPPELLPGQRLEGYEVVSLMESNPRSQLYHVRDVETGQSLAMKTPSERYIDSPAYIERFVTEEWIGKRIDNPHLVKVVTTKSTPKSLFYLMEKIDGLPLSEWITAHPSPDLPAVIDIIDQTIQGLRAMHRRETLHQDLKPNNIMIQEDGTVKIIDLGSAFIAGVNEIQSSLEQEEPLATRRYSAPEYRQGKRPSVRSDQFSLAIVAFELFTGGHHPFGEKYERAENPKDFKNLRRSSSIELNPEIPHWVDEALGRALNLDPNERYASLSEFLRDLRQTRSTVSPNQSLPLVERNPLVFWKALSALLFVLWLVTLWLK